MKESKHAGFWRRTFAFAVDYVLIMFFMMILSIVLRNLFFKMEENLWYISFLITGIYFVLGDSFVEKGQTLGKKIFKIRVVKKSGDYLTLKESFGRYFLVSLVIFQAGLARTFSTGIKSYIVSSTFFQIISIFILLSIAGLLMFNRDKRGLNDYLTDSLVVRSKNVKDVKVPKKLDNFSEGFHHHFIAFSVVGLILLVSLFGLIAISNSVTNYLDEKGILSLSEELENEIGLTDLGLSLGNVNTWNKENSKTLIVSSYLTQDEFHDNSIKAAKTKAILKSFAESDADFSDFDSVMIQYRTGFNLILSDLRVYEYLDVPLKN